MMYAHAAEAGPPCPLDVTERLGESMAACRLSLDNAGAEWGRSHKPLAGQLGQLQNLHRWLKWKATAAALITPAQLLGGGVWLTMHHARVIRQNQLSADLMKA